MTETLTLDHSPPIPIEVDIRNRKYGLIIAHGERTRYNEGIIKILSKKLNEKKFSTARFPFPFALASKKYSKNDLMENEYIFKEVYTLLTSKYPNIEWILCGHGIGAETAVRIAPIASDFGELPPLICINYPLYPPNRPEKVEMRALQAIIGRALFCQGTESNRGDFTRIKNSLRMMADHVDMNAIKGASYELKVKDKDPDRVAYWISNDIEKFIESL